MQITADTTADLNLKKTDSESFIIILSDKPAAENSRAKEVLENLENELGIPEKSVVYKYQKVLTGFSANLSKQKAEALRNNPNVSHVVKDKELKNFSIESSQQDYPVWGLDRIDQREPQLDYVYSYNSTGKGVTVYIVDTGINYSHEEFEGRASLGYDFVKDNEWFNNDPSLEPGGDCHWHGTHVAATVGGKTVGVAKDVNLVSVKVFGCENGTQNSVLLAAVEWITLNAKKPAVVNLSLGDYYEPDMDPTEVAIKNSIATGIHYVIAAGNSASDACEISPARIEQAITVAASDINNEMASFSSFGSCVDLFAPGVDIWSAYHLNDSSFHLGRGTSMAAPHVAGIASLLLEANPNLKPSETHEAIVMNSTENAIKNVPEGPNRLAYSFNEEPVILPASLDLEVFGYKDKGNLRFGLTWNSSLEAYLGKVHIYIDGKLSFETANNGKWFYNPGGKIPDSFQICLTGINDCSNQVTPIMVDDPMQLPNEEPFANFSKDQNGLEVIFTDTSRDEDGEIVAWEWSFNDGNTSYLQNPGHIFPNEGWYYVSLKVTDNRGGTATKGRHLLIEQLPDPEPVNLELTVRTVKRRGNTRAILSWTPSGTSESIEIYNNNEMSLSLNDGSQEINLGKGGGIASFKVCITETSYCSNEVIVEF